MTEAERERWAADVRARMKAVRERLGLTFRQAGEKTGIHFSNISRAESGRTDPSVEWLLDLARGYGVPPVEILGPEYASDLSPPAAKKGKPSPAGAGPVAVAAVPLLGWVGAGPAQDDPFPPGSTVPGLPGEAEYVAYRARGNSMADARIPDGAYLIVRRSPFPKKGEQVVAWLEGDGGNVVKRMGPRRVLESLSDGYWHHRLTDNDVVYGVLVRVIYDV